MKNLLKSIEKSIEKVRLTVEPKIRGLTPIKGRVTFF